MDSIPSHFTCTKCGIEYPLTSEYFKPEKRHTRFGFCTRCRVCRREQERLRYAKNPRHFVEKSQRYYKGHAEEVKQKHRTRNASITPEKRLARNERDKKWRKNNPEKVKAGKKRDYEKHKPKRLATMKRNYAKNKPAIVARARDWKKAHPETVNLGTHKRLARIKGLPFQFNNNDWQRCLNYWDNRCAICGREVSDTHLLAKDHWIPMFDKRPDNPGTVPTNIIPVCHGRKAAKCSGCNENKWKFDPEQWIHSQYPPSEAATIIKRILDYFEWIKQQT